jgi:uncharacterized membrane protein
VSRKRKTIMGLPIGRRRRSRVPTMLKGAAVVLPAIGAARTLASRAGGSSGGSGGSGGGDGPGPLEKSRDLVGRGADTVEHGREIVEKGKEYAGKAKNAVDTVSNVQRAAARHDSTIGKVGAAVGAVIRGNDGAKAPRLSHLIEQHADIAASLDVVYNQWTQFEMFPQITKGADRVHQAEDDSVEWSSKIGPSRREWQAHITEQVPDQRIAWESDGVRMKGVVTFHRLADELTRVLVQIEYDPSGPVEHVGNLLRVQRRRVKRDLRLFKHFVELRGEATGAWRGELHGQGHADQATSNDNGSADREDGDRSGSDAARGRQSGSDGGRDNGRESGAERSSGSSAGDDEGRRRAGARS